MNKSAIISSLSLSYTNFINFVSVLTEEESEFAPPEKWSPAQQLEHLCRSTKPLVLATRLPRFIVGIIFGKVNRNSKSYDELVEKYQHKLSEGYKATGNYIPPKIYASQKVFLENKLAHIINAIEDNLDNFSEEELDKYILPHPLLGKLTFREMMYFTIYHAQHHEKIVRGYFSKG